MLIGVEDRTRHVRGVKEPLDLEERLANLISDHIVPRLVPELEIVPWRRSHVLAIQVYASPVRPHYIRREGLDQGVYVRVGSTNRRADRGLHALTGDRRGWHAVRVNDQYRIVFRFDGADAFDVRCTDYH